MNSLSKLTLSMIVFLLVMACSAYAQIVKTVHSFSGEDGQGPLQVLLAQGRDGALYGTTFAGGANGLGTIFKQQAGGIKNVVLHSFSGSDGSLPGAGLTLATDGSFYGTAETGGTTGNGVLFKITSSGTFSTLYNFTGGTDGAFPIAPPIQAIDGNFYGTTAGSTSQNSTVYKLTPAGAFSTVYTFDSTSGYFPQAPLLQATDGTLYATTTTGGSFNCGSIVQITTTGALKHIHSFNCGKEGGVPLSPLIQAADGQFYGTADSGGAAGAGTAFRLNPNWTFTVLHSFGTTPGDGKNPGSGFVQGTDAKLYSATAGGGSASAGSLFTLTTGGDYSQLYSFPAIQKAPSQEPDDPPLQHTSGTFYGSTLSGGGNGLGSVYTLNMNLGPFVALVHYQGKAGSTAQILGQGFTGTTGVTFNGVAGTSFSVVSDTYLTAVVPDGATTGPVVVATLGGALTSNKSFRIVP